MNFKYLNVKDFSVEDENKKRIVKGYASVFGNIDSYGECVAKGAFEKSLKNRQIKFLFNHDKFQVIGKIIEIKEDERGLFFVASLVSGIQKADEVYLLLKSGAISGVSIGYIVADYEMQHDVKLLKEIDLFEISIVTFPANELAEVVEVKNAEKFSSKNDEDFDIVALHKSVQHLSNSVKSLSNFFVN